MDFQWQAIEKLVPVASLVKFDAPYVHKQWFEYAPGVLLKQIFQNYGSSEVRLMIDGVPKQKEWYNTWELFKKMTYHHEHLRGLVYETTRDLSCGPRCFDACFDCEIFWQTICTYAQQNNMPSKDIWAKMAKDMSSVLVEDNPTTNQRMWCLEGSLGEGRLAEAIVILEGEGEVVDGREVEDRTDWANVIPYLKEGQPCLAKSLAALSRPVSREKLITHLGSLSKPFVLVRCYQNGLIEWRPAGTAYPENEVKASS